MDSDQDKDSSSHVLLRPAPTHTGAAAKRGASALENGEPATAKSAQALKRARKKKREATAKKQAQKSAGSQPAQKALTAPTACESRHRRQEGPRERGRQGQERGEGRREEPFAEGHQAEDRGRQVVLLRLFQGREMRGESVQVCTRLLVVPQQPSGRRRRPAELPNEEGAEAGDNRRGYRARG